MPLCNRCGKSPGILNVIGETTTDGGYCMECWLHGAYQIDEALADEAPTTTTFWWRRTPDPRVLRFMYLCGVALLIVVGLVAFGAVGGEEVGSESLAPGNWVGLSFLAAAGGLLVWIGDVRHEA